MLLVLPPPSGRKPVRPKFLDRVTKPAGVVPGFGVGACNRRFCASLLLLLTTMAPSLATHPSPLATHHPAPTRWNGWLKGRHMRPPAGDGSCNRQVAFDTGPTPRLFPNGARQPVSGQTARRPAASNRHRPRRFGARVTSTGPLSAGGCRTPPSLLPGAKTLTHACRKRMHLPVSIDTV